MPYICNNGFTIHKLNYLVKFRECPGICARIEQKKDIHYLEF